MRDVVAPQVELVADPLLGEQRRRGACVDSSDAGRVLPLALAADQQQAEPRAQPVEVVAAEVPDVVERVVEVGGARRARPSRSSVDGS